MYGVLEGKSERKKPMGRPKNPKASAGFEPANLGTKGQHATPRPLKPYNIYIYIYIYIYVYIISKDQVCVKRNQVRVRSCSEGKSDGAHE